MNPRDRLPRSDREQPGIHPNESQKRRFVGGPGILPGVVGAVLALLVFVVLALGLGEGALGPLDATVAGWLNALRSPAVDGLMLAATFLGNPWPMTLITVLAVLWMLFQRHWRAALAAAVASLGSSVLCEICKGLFARSRPELPQMVSATGYSFPSSHAMVCFAFYFWLAWKLYRTGYNRLWVKLGIGACFFLAVLIGVSRIYLGVHHASDVLAGFALGALWDLLVVFPLER